MKKVLIILFVFMAVFVMPSFSSPTGGGDSVAKFSIPNIIDSDLTIADSQVELINTEIDFIIIENTVPVARSKMSTLSRLSAMKSNIKLKAVEELMLRKTTVNVISENIIRHVWLAS